jgi:Cys-tRNA(Pro)/Cys-tRNA(Cys) deacylase
VVLDASTQDFETIYVSAGKRGLQVELAPADLLAITGGTLAVIQNPIV